MKDSNALEKEFASKIVREPGWPTPTYFLHKLKCLVCSLHFVVCSDHEEWPPVRELTEQVIHCPECGQTKQFMRWRKEVPGFIFEAVPGDADIVGIQMGNDPRKGERA